MSLFTAAIRRAPLQSIRFAISGVWPSLSGTANSKTWANTSQLSIPRAMHIQSIPMCMSTLMEPHYFSTDE